MEERNKNLPVEHKEGESVDPLGVMPRESAKELVRSLPGLSPCSNGKVGGGMQQSKGGIRRLIIDRTWRPIIRQSGENIRWGTSLVHETGEEKRRKPTMGGDILVRKGIVGGQGAAQRVPAELPSWTGSKIMDGPFM